jgi:hypothetical protein
VSQQLLGHVGRALEHGLLFRAQRGAVVDFFQCFGRQGEGRELRQHGRDLELPALRQLQLVGERADVLLDALRAPERHRIAERHHLGQHLDAAVQGLLEQRLLRQCQAMQLDGGLDGFEQLGGRTRLDQEAKHGALVDGGDRGVDLGVAREQDARGVRKSRPGFGQQLRAVHAGHAHVRNQHRGGRLARQELERGRAAGGRLHVVAPA